MSAKYYLDISSWIIDDSPDAPETFSLNQVRAMDAYALLSDNFIESIIISFCRTGHLTIDSNGSIRKMPFAYWDVPTPIEYHNYKS